MFTDMACTFLNIQDSAQYDFSVPTPECRRDIIPKRHQPNRF